MNTSIKTDHKGTSFCIIINFQIQVQKIPNYICTFIKKIYVVTKSQVLVILRFYLSFYDRLFEVIDKNSVETTEITTIKSRFYSCKLRDPNSF